MDDTILLRNQLLHTQRLFRELQLVDVQGPVFETLIGLAKFKAAADIAVSDVRQLILDPASTTAIKTLIKVVVHSKIRLAQLITDAQDEANRRSDVINNDGLASVDGMMSVSKVELMAQEVLRLRQALEAMKQQQAQVAMQTQLQHMAQAADAAAAAASDPCQPTLCAPVAGPGPALKRSPLPAAASQGQARSPPQARPVLAAAPSGRPNMSALLAGASVAKLKRVGGGQGEADAQEAAPAVVRATTASPAAAAAESTKADGPAMTLQAALMRKFANATPARGGRPGGATAAAGAAGTSRLSLASSPGTPSSWDPDSPPKAQQQGQRQVGLGAAAVMAKRRSARNVLHHHMAMAGGGGEGAGGAGAAASSPLAQGGPAGVMRRQASVGHMPPPAAPAPVPQAGGVPVVQAAPPPPAAPLPPALARLQQATSARKKRAGSEEGWSSEEEKGETPQRPTSIAGGAVVGGRKVPSSSPPRPAPSGPRSFEPQPLSALPRPPMDLLASIRKVARVEEEEKRMHAAGPAAQPAVPTVQDSHSTPAKPKALLVGIQGFALGNLKKAPAAPSLPPVAPPVPSTVALTAHTAAALNAGRGPVSSQGPGPSKPIPVTPARRGAPSQAVPPSPGPASLAVGAGGGGGGSVAAQAATARLGLRKTGISRE